VEDEPREPDYRFTLANERTLLAWVRTVLALDAGGLAVIRFGPSLWLNGAREAAGIFLILLGSVTAAASYRRWVRVDAAMRAGAPLPGTAVPRLLATSLAALSAVLIALLLVDRLANGR
jgi:putative membrane protein